MGLFDDVMGMAGQFAAGGNNPQAQVMQTLAGMLSHGGGLTGLVQAFEQSGLSSQMASWIGTGQNLPVTAQQIMQVLGQGKISELASQAGVGHEDIAGLIAKVLPQLIDKATPNGAIPASFDLSSLMAMSKSLFG